MATPESIEILDIAVEECAVLRASLFKRIKDKTSHEEAVAIATAFVYQAAHIYRALGGSRMVVAQFHNMADVAATEK